MLRSMKDLNDCEIGASDGHVGHVKDVYFDDRQWVARYLVVDASSWFSGHKVLISPIAIHEPNWSAGVLPVSLTREQVKNAPDIDTALPVTRQNEVQYSGYYGYPYYWGGTGLWGGSSYPGLMAASWGNIDEHAYQHGEHGVENRLSTRASPDSRDDPHLRSCKAVIGYHIHASDGEVGHVQDLLLDEETWAVRYIVVNTSNWRMGHSVLIAPQWITDVRWSDESVSVGLTRELVKSSPLYVPSAAFNREQEVDLYSHYDRSGYWLTETSHESESSHR